MATLGEKDVLIAPSPAINSDQILSEYPLHWYVWNKDASSIEEELALAHVSTSVWQNSLVASACTDHSSIDLSGLSCSRPWLRLKIRMDSFSDWQRKNRYSRKNAASLSGNFRWCQLCEGSFAWWLWRQCYKPRRVEWWVIFWQFNFRQYYVNDNQQKLFTEILFNVKQ